MFKYKVEYYKVENGEETMVDITKQCHAPVMNKCTLDETLDMTTLAMFQSDFNTAFEPFTKFKITVTEEETGEKMEIYRYLANDQMEQTVLVKPYKYDHSLTLIEPTKILEREVCDNLTFTNTLLALDAEDPQPAQMIVLKNEHKQYELRDGTTEPVFLTPVETNTVINLQDCDMLYRDSNIWREFNRRELRIIKPGGAEEVVSIGTQFTYDKPGVYKLVYNYYNALAHRDTLSLCYSVLVYDAQNKPKKKTVLDGVNRLLAVTPLRRKGQKQKYHVSAEFVNKYQAMDAPEFAITSKNLFEALSEFGGYIHAIPYLCVTDWNWNTIDFMELGGHEEAVIDTPYSAFFETKDIEEYCAAIDTNAENIMNVENQAQGTVVEPYDGGYMSVRAEEGTLEISETTSIFPTQRPVYKVIQLEAGLDITNMVDITKEVKESAQYNLLSSVEEEYGVSKSYALEYTQGQRNVKGLTFNRDVGVLLKKYAIVNILNNHEVTCSNADVPNLKFRIRYIPYTFMRIKQYKTNYKDYNTDESMIYNQQSNVLDSIAYGEHLKGVVTKIGNAEHIITYYFQHLRDLPQVGKMYKGYYIAQTDAEFWQTFIKTTVRFSKDYNKLSEYIGLKNEQRYYEVSEKQSMERNLNYGEFCVVGDDMATTDAGITETGCEAFRQTFLQQADAYYIRPASCVEAQGYVGDLAQQKCLLPVSSLACGNSIVLNFSYLDNFTAGYRSGTDGNRDNRLQEYVPYADGYGKLDALRVNVFSKLLQVGDDIANALPGFHKYANGYQYFSFWDAPFLIDKDSRETLNITLQTHLLKNRRNIVIGTALAQNNPIVSGIIEKRVAKILLLDYNIGAFDRFITGGTPLQVDLALLIKQSGKKIIINSITASVNCRSWALVSSDTNELLLGVNEPLEPGVQSKSIYLNFVSKAG